MVKVAVGVSRSRAHLSVSLSMVRAVASFENSRCVDFNKKNYKNPRAPIFPLPLVFRRLGRGRMFGVSSRGNEATNAEIKEI